MAPSWSTHPRPRRGERPRSPPPARSGSSEMLGLLDPRPRAQSDAGIRLRPAGATSGSSTTDAPPASTTTSVREDLDPRRHRRSLGGPGLPATPDPMPRAPSGVPSGTWSRRRVRVRARTFRTIAPRADPVDRPLVRKQLRRVRRGRVVLRPRLDRSLVERAERPHEQRPAERPPAAPRAIRRPRRPRSSSPPWPGSARVHPLVHQHHGDARPLVALEDRPLHGRGATPPRQQREVDVHRPEARDVEDVRRQDLAVGPTTSASGSSASSASKPSPRARPRPRGSGAPAPSRRPRRRSA